MPRRECPLQTDLRRLLRAEFPDGATPFQLARLIGKDGSNVRAALKSMPDVYIDRWEQTEVEGFYRAIYCAVEVPSDCPQPEAA